MLTFSDKWKLGSNIVENKSLDSKLQKTFDLKNVAKVLSHYIDMWFRSVQHSAVE